MRPAPRLLPTAAESQSQSRQTDSYWDARELFRAAGVDVSRRPAGRDRCTRRRQPPDDIGYPVVLKAMGLLHKSDSGGVALGLSSDDELTRRR